MTWEQVATIASIASSIAILVTLVYLAIQAKQTKNALFAASRQGTMTAEVELLCASFSGQNIDSLIHKDPAQLTTSENFTVANWCAAFIRIREYAWFQYKAGILDELTWRSYVGPVGRILTYPNLHPWWIRFSEEVDPEFRTYIDREIHG